MDASGASPPVSTTCPYCGVGCGVLVQRLASGEFTVRGDPDHPANFGRLCSKGAALAQTLGLEERLLHPQIGGRQTSWNEALTAVAGGFSRIVAQHGPDSVAFYLSGQLLTEDYYVANKLMKGFVGSGNVDTNSRLCMASAVAGHQRAFGSDTVPGCYEDLEQADLLVLVGSNTAWCHPVVYQRVVQAQQQRPSLKIVVIDPRRTPTCDAADLHLAIKPGTDAWLFNGLLAYLHRWQRLNRDYIDRATDGFDAALAAACASAPSTAAVAQMCDVNEAALAQFYEWFACTERTVTLFSQGVNQSSSGTDKVNGIINCHLATGRIGRPGAAPFSITGQPNAMGGREVGGMANQLAAHLDFGERSRSLLARFWKTAKVAARPGLKAVELFQAIEAGRIKAVWIMATNPVVSLPDADQVRRALKRCELVVVSDCVRSTDTSACAHILLPAAAWGEKQGTVTNSERRISRQRAFRPPPGDARPDWWMVSQVAKRMGFGQHFAYENPAEIFHEHARLSGFENHGTRAFDISALASIDDHAYEGLHPLQWPLPPQQPDGTARMFADGRFFTASGRAQFVAVVPRPPACSSEPAYPLVLNSGRVRDHWHTMTRTGLAPRLCAHTHEPRIEIHPSDARASGLSDGMLACVTSPQGTMLGRVSVSTRERVGCVFAPIHWNAQFAAQARVGALTPAATDPVSAQPELKHTPVAVAPLPLTWHAFVLTRVALPAEALSAFDYWVRSRGDGYGHYELAGRTTPEWQVWTRRWLGEGEWLEFFDAAAGQVRAARIEGKRLHSCLFVAVDHRLPPRDHLGTLFAESDFGAADRLALLSGVPVRAAAARGRIVCACFGVGESVLREAIERQGLRTPAAIGAALAAGTGCGSCVPELTALIADLGRGLP